MYFNSIKVQLELIILILCSVKCLYFNSIKVQLEQVRFFGYFFALAYFNSIKVQLELTNNKKLVEQLQISIP